MERKEKIALKKFSVLLPRQSRDTHETEVPSSFPPSPFSRPERRLLKSRKLAGKREKET